MSPFPDVSVANVANSSWWNLLQLIVFELFLLEIYVNIARVYVCGRVNPIVLASGKRGWLQWVEILYAIAIVIWGAEVIAYSIEFDARILPATMHTPLFESSVTRGAGLLLNTIAVVLYAIESRSLGTSWRIGVETEYHEKLITDGVYGMARHPIYSTLFVLLLGTFLINATPLFAVLSLTVGITLHLQSLEEDRRLLDHYGDVFARYSHSTPRYFSWRSLSRSLAGRRNPNAGYAVGAHLSKRLRWFFGAATANERSVLSWWESRRLGYNLSVMAMSLAAAVVFAGWQLGADLAGGSWPRPALVELTWGVLLALALTVSANVWYTLGWLIESAVRLAIGTRSSGLNRRLLLTGMAFSAVFIVAFYWRY